MKACRLITLFTKGRKVDLDGDEKKVMRRLTKSLVEEYQDKKARKTE
jgi:hypothetical protein